MSQHENTDYFVPRMRKATLWDAWLLHRWRTANEVSKYFENQDVNSFGRHFLWLSRYLYSNKSGSMFFFLYGFRRCGMTRVDFNKTTKELEISILVAPAFRSMGLGKKLLDSTIGYVSENLDVCRVIARINKNNLPSLKMFSKYGFTEFHSDDFYNYLELRID